MQLSADAGDAKTPPHLVSRTEVAVRYWLAPKEPQI
jgi:hypothetical protein